MTNKILSLILSVVLVFSLVGITSVSAETAERTVLYEEDFEQLSTVKYIIFNATLGDNEYPVTLKPNYKLSIHAGVDTDICAIIDLKKIFNN